MSRPLSSLYFRFQSIFGELLLASTWLRNKASSPDNRPHRQLALVLVPAALVLALELVVVPVEWLLALARALVTLLEPQLVLVLAPVV